MLALFRTSEVFDYLILPKYYDVSPRQSAGIQRLCREEFLKVSKFQKFRFSETLFPFIVYAFLISLSHRLLVFV